MISLTRWRAPRVWRSTLTCIDAKVRFPTPIIGTAAPAASSTAPPLKTNGRRWSKVFCCRARRCADPLQSVAFRCDDLLGDGAPNRNGVDRIVLREPPEDRHLRSQHVALGHSAQHALRRILNDPERPRRAQLRQLHSNRAPP